MLLLVHICSSKDIKPQMSHFVINENCSISVYFSIRHMETSPGLVITVLG